MTARLWTGILAPPAAWLADVQLCYGFQRYACVHRAQWLLWTFTAVTLLITLFGGMQARRGLAADPARRFMGLAGLFIAASFFLAIISTAIALIHYGPCD